MNDAVVAHARMSTAVSGVAQQSSSSGREALLAAHAATLQTLLTADVSGDATSDIPTYSVEAVEAAEGAAPMTLFHMSRVASTHGLAQRWPWQRVQQDDWLLFLATEQSAGQGQRQNTWQSPPGNLYLTLLFRVTDPHIMARCLLTQATAWTVLQTLSNHAPAAAPHLSLKWINDVFLYDKKICGTLITADNVGQEYYYQVSMGVNLNVSPPHLDAAIALADVTHQPIPVKAFAVALAVRFRATMAALFGAADAREQIRAAIDATLQFKHQRVNIWDYQLTHVEHSGVFLGINAFGHARIQAADGTVQELFDGRMRLAPPS